MVKLYSIQALSFTMNKDVYAAFNWTAQNRPDYLEAIEKRTNGSSWGSETHWTYLGSLPWQEMPEENWNESIHVKGCRYFFLTHTDVAKYLPGARSNVRPLNDFEEQVVDSHIHISFGRHGHELVSALVMPEEPTEAWLVLGPACDTTGMLLPDQWIVRTAFPGPMLASMKHIPGYETKSLRELRALNLPIAVKGINVSPVMDEISDSQLEEECRRRFRYLDIQFVGGDIPNMESEEDCLEAFIFRGFSGTGKSRLASLFIPDELIFSADDFPLIYDEEGRYQFQLQQAAHDWTMCRLVEAAQKKLTPIAYCNTNSQRKYYQKAEETLKQQGYSVQIVRTEDLTLSDGSYSTNVHGTPPGVVLRQFLQLAENPHIRQSRILASRKSDEKEKQVFILDKDGTLVTGRDGSVPSAGNQLPIPVMQAWVRARYNEGHVIVVASNQAGVAAKHKTPESLLEEAKELAQLYPEIDLICFCPDWDGEVLWIWEKSDEDFQEFIQSELSEKVGEVFQPFRKPGCGMIEAILTVFYHQIKGEAIFVGNDTADKLAAAAAGIQFMHPWEIFLQDIGSTTYWG
jgi:D-glycero-D-manno-heptose 1,7-bisphosphate phosphatase